MPPLPNISGRQLIRVLHAIGYETVRQRGSHVRLTHPEHGRRKPTSVPLHKQLKRGTLASILRDVGLSVEELIELLK